MFLNSIPTVSASTAIAAMSASNCDYLKVAGSMELIKFLDQQNTRGVDIESVQFSDSVYKINKRDKQQKRLLIITTSTIYNFKEGNFKSCQRSIPISSLRGIVLSNQNDEMLLQVRNDYDYRLIIVRKADALRIMSESFERITGTRLNVEIIDDLNCVQIKKADMKKLRSTSTEFNSNNASLLTSGPMTPSNTATTPTTLTPSSSSCVNPSTFTSASTNTNPNTISQSTRTTMDAPFNMSRGFAASMASPSVSGGPLYGLPPSTSTALGFNPNSLSDIKPTIEGWLTKKGEVNLIWRRRYFRLSESNLLYYEARLKGSMEIDEGGEVRAWINKRFSMIPNQGSANSKINSNNNNSLIPPPSSSSSSDSSSSSPTISPLLYEYKLSAAYNISSDRHLRDILLDPDRYAAFVAFCEKQNFHENFQNNNNNENTNSTDNNNTSSSSSSSSSTLSNPTTSPSQYNASGNPKFYFAVERYKSLCSSLADSSSSASQSDNNNNSASSSSQLLTEADAIYLDYLSPSPRQQPINAPSAVKEAIGSLLARVKLAREKATNDTASSSTSSSSSSNSDSTPCLNSDMFNILQQFSLDYMQTNNLPSYLEHSKKSELSIVKEFKIKTELTELDKKKQSCFNCLTSFGLLKRRNVCRYCGDVFCSNCLSKTAQLPSEYGINEPIKVCDECFGSLSLSHSHPNAFSYANKKSAKAMNLAASSPQELMSWMKAIKEAIAMKKAKVNNSNSNSSSNNNNTESNHPHHTSVPNNNSMQFASPKEGWLMKEDPSTKIWRRRYFILNPMLGCLYYYELTLKGNLALAQGAGVHSTLRKPTLSASDSCFGGLLSKSAFGYRFTISYGGRLYLLAADTEETMEKWIESLQRAIKRAKGGLTNNTVAGFGSGLSAMIQDANATPLANANANAATTTTTAAANADQYSSSYTQRAPEGEVTFVFTDVMNSTRLWESAPEAMNKALEKHDSLLRMLLNVFKGYEVKTEGDAFMVTFFNPLDAVRWCIAVQQSLLEAVWPVDLLKQSAGKQVFDDKGKLVWNGIRIRMGIHFGHPACRRNPITNRMDYFGPTVNRAARIADSGHGGQIVCTAEVRDRILEGLSHGEFPNQTIHLLDLGCHKYKGIPEPVQVFQVYNDLLAGRNPFPNLRTTKSDEETPSLAGTNSSSTNAPASPNSSSSSPPNSVSPSSVPLPSSLISPSTAPALLTLTSPPTPPPDSLPAGTDFDSPIPSPRALGIPIQDIYNEGPNLPVNLSNNLGNNHVITEEQEEDDEDEEEAEEQNIPASSSSSVAAASSSTAATANTSIENDPLSTTSNDPQTDATAPRPKHLIVDSISSLPAALSSSSTSSSSSSNHNPSTSNANSLPNFVPSTGSIGSDQFNSFGIVPTPNEAPLSNISSSDLPSTSQSSDSSNSSTNHELNSKSISNSPY